MEADVLFCGPVGVRVEAALPLRPGEPSRLRPQTVPSARAAVRWMPALGRDEMLVAGGEQMETN